MATEELVRSDVEKELLSQHVTQYLTLDEQIVELTAQMKRLKTQQSLHCKFIVDDLRLHKNRKVETLNTDLVVSESVGQASLSIPLITRVCNTMFGDSASTKRFISALQVERKQAAGQRVRLKRLKKRSVQV